MRFSAKISLSCPLVLLWYSTSKGTGQQRPCLSRVASTRPPALLPKGYLKTSYERKQSPSFFGNPRPSGITPEIGRENHYGCRNESFCRKRSSQPEHSTNNGSSFAFVTSCRPLWVFTRGRTLPLVTLVFSFCPGLRPDPPSFCPA